MAETKYGKYIIKQKRHPKKEAPWSPPISSAPKAEGGRILYLDSDVIKNAFYVECAWILPTSSWAKAQTNTGSHSHDFDEVIAFFGTDPENPLELGAEAELWLGDEKHIINSSCLVFVPKGLKHCPLTFTKVDKPVFHFTAGTGQMYF